MRHTEKYAASLFGVRGSRNDVTRPIGTDQVEVTCGISESIENERTFTGEGAAMHPMTFDSRICNRSAVDVDNAAAVMLRTTGKRQQEQRTNQPADSHEF